MENSTSLLRYVPGRPHWWQWLTVLSLDAPLVALAWQGVIARVTRGALQPHHHFILGAAVWLAYAADRWIEGWRLDPEQVRTQRHWFYQRWRWPVAIVWLGVMITAVILSFARLSSAELSWGFLLLAPVLIYLLSHQLVHREARWRAPKEICVALLFTAGAACFPLADASNATVAVLVPLALFGLLCFADCALISLWEADVDREHGQTSLALQFPHGRPFVRALPWLIAVAAIAFAKTETGPLRTANVCAAASGVLLGSLDLASPRLGRQLTRALVDMTLLTPFALLVFEYFLFR